MAILTKQAILREIEAGNIVIDPFEPENLNPNSIDLRLADKLLVYGKGLRFTDNGNFAYLSPNELGELDPTKDNPTVELPIHANGFTLHPGILYLASTVEHTETRRHVPCIEGKSSIARLGIDVHKTAGFGDTGFSGKFCLEISVVHPVRVFAGMRFCQIIYHTIEGEPTPYQGKYMNQSGPVASRSWKDFQQGKG